MNKDLVQADFKRVFLRDVPLLDLRAPVEYAAGSFPCAENIPILTDEQRHIIGLEYAEQGQSAAVELGQALATQEIQEQRLIAWQGFLEQHPDGYLFCFRGGLRSKTAQAWLAERDGDYALVEGGYKAMRQYLLDEFERLCLAGNIILVSGATGVGKTELIKVHAPSIDLEGRAKHRGSAFGHTFTPQPAQIDWENQIIIDWMKCQAATNRPVLIEAESHLIGRVHLPNILQTAMAKAPIIELEASTDERVDRIYRDYVVHSLDHFKSQSEHPWQPLQDHILACLHRIKSRLGGKRHQQLANAVPQAVLQLQTQQGPDGFRDIITVLLEQYYDGLYRYHADKKSSNRVYRGDMSAVLGWLKNR